LSNNTPPVFRNLIDHKLQIAGREITLAGDAEAYPADYGVYNGVHIVLFWKDSGTLTNRNVQGHDDDGNLLWAVQPITDEPGISDWYSGIGWSEEDQAVYLRTFYEGSALLDEKSGRITKTNLD